MAMKGDAPAQEIFHRVGYALGIAIADLVNIFNLPMYVVGGGVSSAWDAFAPTIIETVRKNSFVYRATAPAGMPSATASTANVQDGSARPTVITRALLGSDAGLIGAARLPMIAAPTSAGAESLPV